MKITRKLKLICQKLVDEDSDIRHSLLDISEDFQDLFSQGKEIPAYLQKEIKKLKVEIKEIQPRFPSHRKTSILFDHEGLGQKGVQKAKDLARRIISVYKSMEKTE